MLASGQLDRLITIEQRSTSRDSATGAEVVSWVALAQVWASREEFTNTGASEEYVRNGVVVHGGISKMRIRYRTDVDTTCRLNLGGGHLRQVTGLAEIGRGEGLELTCREWSHE